MVEVVSTGVSHMCDNSTVSVIAYCVYKCHCNTRAHRTRTHIGVHLLSLRALRLVQYEFAISAIWMWLVQYGCG